MNKSHDKPYTAANLKLANLEYLIQNGQPVFGVFSQVKSINYLDYYSHLISQKSLPNWRKELKANQFCFIQILQPPYRCASRSQRLSLRPVLSFTFIMRILSS